MTTAEKKVLDQECPKKELALESPFDAMLPERLQSLQLRKPAETHKELVTKYLEDTKTILTWKKEAEEFLRNCVWSMAQVEVDEKHKDARVEILKSKQHELSGSVPKWNLDRPQAADKHVVAQSLEEANGILWRRLNGFCHRFIRGFELQVTELRSMNMFGEWQWYEGSTTVCDYWYSRAVVRQSHQGTTTEKKRRTTVKKGVRNNIHKTYEDTFRTDRYRCVDLLQRHTHELYNAKLSWDVKKPVFIQNLLNAIPDWISSHITIVQGDMVQEKIEEKEVDRQDWSNTRIVNSELVESRMVSSRPIYSPAVALGKYVLAGWCDRDFRQEQWARKNGVLNNGIGITLFRSK